MNHYYASNFFSPVLASIYQILNQRGDVVVEIISDSVTNYMGTLTVKLFQINNINPLLEVILDVVAVSKAFIQAKQTYEFKF